MAITLAQICDAIESTLDDATPGTPATGITSQSYDELTEGVHDTPLLQVYPESGTQDVGGMTDRSTFSAGVRQTSVVVHADYFAEERGVGIGQEMARLVDGIDAITNVIEGQDQKPYFGLVGIKAFSWRWEHVTFDYGGVRYMGARFFITLRVF
jgi:hypothetical protein